MLAALLSGASAQSGSIVTFSMLQSNIAALHVERRQHAVVTVSWCSCLSCFEPLLVRRPAFPTLHPGWHPGPALCTQVHPCFVPLFFLQFPLLGTSFSAWLMGSSDKTDCKTPVV